MPVVTISRGPGSEGRALAERVAQDLGYELVGREELLHAAARHGVPEAQLQEALLEAPSFWDRLTLGRSRYLAFVQAALCERAAADNLVYEGNAGHLLLRGIDHLLCVRLIAPVAHRVEVEMERLGTSRADAARYVEEADHQRESWTRQLYGVDWLDPTLYDLTLNLRTLTLEGAVEAVVTMSRRPEFVATEHSRRAMADLLLESRVRAALAADHHTAAADVRVSVHNGVVALRGRLRPASMVDAVLEVTRGVKGVREVDNRDLAAPEYTV